VIGPHRFTIGYGTKEREKLMSTHATPKFIGGQNIAMKVPPHQWDDTVAFYRDVVGLSVVENPFDQDPPSVGFAFGANNLWIDRVVGISQAEIWLQLTTDDAAAAAGHLKDSQVTRCDEIEPLPAESPAFWISSPASIVHLVSEV